MNTRGDLYWTDKDGNVRALRTSHPMEKENQNLKRYITKLELEIKELRKAMNVGQKP